MKTQSKNKEYKYVYCIVNKKIKNNFGNTQKSKIFGVPEISDFGDIGVNENKIYSISYKEFSIIVSDCSIKEIKNKKEIDLAIEHQYVVDAMIKKFNSLIPFNAGTLIKEEKIKNWIDKDYKKLINILKKIKNKQEFGIQIFYNTKIKKQELAGKVRDYIDKQKKLRKELMSKLIKHKENFYNQINNLVDEVKNIEISTSLGEKQILLNVTCLVDRNKTKKLKNYLKKINNMKDFSVDFNGPWTPYSFVK